MEIILKAPEPATVKRIEFIIENLARPKIEHPKPNHYYPCSDITLCLGLMAYYEFGLLKPHGIDLTFKNNPYTHGFENNYFKFTSISNYSDQPSKAAIPKRG